jgi:16S rRNA C1402 N4-methylase RsmH
VKRHPSFQELEEALRIGEHRERERIVSKIQERVAELRACSKVDNCQELARLIESYIPEWTERN